MPFDFSKKGYEAKLAPAGPHQGTIKDLSVNEGADATWMNTVFDLPDSGHSLTRLECIDATEDSENVERLGDGMGWMEQLAKATNVDLSSLQTTDDIMESFIGASLTVIVAHRRKGGIKRAVVKTVTAANSPETTRKTAQKVAGTKG